MRRLILSVLASLCLCLSSCWDKHGKPAVERPYELSQDTMRAGTRDTILTGVLGEETAMSSLQLITDNGDTLSICKTSADGIEGRMLGDVRNYEDRVMVMAKLNAEDELFMSTFLNISQLEGNWKDSSTTLSLSSDSSVASRGTNYTHWRVERCRLLLMGEHAMEYGTTQLVDTASIEGLDEDSLWLSIPRHGQLRLGRSLAK